MFRALFLFLMLTPLTYATEQESDWVVYKGEKCEMETHWLFPSPLEAYFELNKTLKSPFESTSTGNYRGHVATWQASEGKLLLTQIDPASGGKKFQAPEGMMKSLFRDRLDSKGRVFADWYSGNLCIFAKPKKMLYQHQNDEKPREVIEFTEVALLQVQKGQIIHDTSFPWEEYWTKFNLLENARNVPKTEADALNERFAFLDAHDKNWNKAPGAEEAFSSMHKESDFPVMLSRQLDRRVDIPLTRFVVVKDATVDFSDSSWVIGSDLRIQPGMNLLIMDMNPTGVPHGPWSSHTGGSVLVVVQLGKLEAKQIKLDKKSTPYARFVNNYSHADEKDETLEGKIDIELTPEGKTLLSGNIRITSIRPTTFQEIVLKNDVVPLKTIIEHLKVECAESTFKQDPNELYEEILAKSKNKSK